MIGLSSTDSGFELTDFDRSLRSKHVNQIEFWGLSSKADRHWGFSGQKAPVVLDKVVNYLKRQNVEYITDRKLTDDLLKLNEARAQLSISRKVGQEFKESGVMAGTESNKFLEFIDRKLSRRLKEHQIKAALHLLSVVNGANFSVPGAGKTSVVLATYAWLKELGEVDSLFVVGPPACFRPWQDEFRETIGREPSTEILAGGNVEARRLKYYSPSGALADLYLTTFQTLLKDAEEAPYLFNRANRSFFLVVDEAHYIKQQGGSWAKSVLGLSLFAQRRCVLTGTPFPHSYADAVNIFKTLYPVAPPLGSVEQTKLTHLIKSKRQVEAVELLEATIGPLFYRVRKSDLNLAKQEFCEPIIVEMCPVERMLYDTVLGRIKKQSQEDFMRDFETVQSLQKGRIMRMRQAISYAKLLTSAIDGYDEELIDEREDLATQIVAYDSLEVPGKITALLNKIEELRTDSQKVVVWSNFIGTLNLIKESCMTNGWNAEIICGNTPTENRYDDNILTREKIIEKFRRADSGLDILIANPAACAESISLHKTCSHAIYYDLSYNCAQYLQSLDRIHRVGGSEQKPSHYHFLQYDQTFENDILENVMAKWHDMALIIDKEFPVYEMNFDNIEADAYERIFG